MLSKKYINKSTRKKTKKEKINNKKINKVKKNNHKYLKDIIDKRYVFLTVIIILLFSIIIGRLFQLQYIDNDKYKEKLTISTIKSVESSSAPRGRIYDRNYNLLVDNVAIKTIYYKKENDVTTKKEIELAYKLGNLLEIDYSNLNETKLKNFWYLNNIDKAKSKITDEERKLQKERKLSSEDIENLIFERITDEELNEYNEVDKEAAYIYYLMNKGYSYSEKIIKNENVTEEEYAIISENIDNLMGVNTKLDWERVYKYDSVFRSILGNVSSNNQGIPSELAEYYLKNGYNLDDRVGISYIEYQYENYLKGTKAIYKVSTDNNYELVSEGTRGDDIVLTIDINLQSYLENMLESEVLNTKGDTNTDYYDRSFVVISDPKTGEILAMSGKQVKIDENGNKKVIDYTPGVVTLPVTPGSIVKGASMLVGYKNGAINIGDKILDECIKIKDTPLKCSWRTMGEINDLYALQYSSNVYQYKIAIKVGGGTYNYNEALTINEDAFKKYRSMYAEFGLGVKTGIDLPVESLGYSGTSKLPGHLLDYAIGQYDTYTPIQLSQYINTLANDGTRLQPYLLKEVYEPSVNKEDKFGTLLYKAEPTILGTIDVEEKYIDRVQEGFNLVITNGLGYGYMGNYFNSAGKTGTSQSFIDTDTDGVVDTETITTSFVGYAPYDNPKMTIVVVSPDISHNYGDSAYTNGVTKRISAQIVNKFFEINN